MEIFSGSACHKEKTFDSPQRLATPCVERCFCKNALRQFIGCKRDFISLAAVIFSTVREACVVAFGTTLSFAKRQRSCRARAALHGYSFALRTWLYYQHVLSFGVAGFAYDSAAVCALTHALGTLVEQIRNGVGGVP
jgi:hypothetical protein